MYNSILCDVREYNNCGRTNNSFDGQLIPLINSFLFRSAQAGIGKKGFQVINENQTWADFLGDNVDSFIMLKTYISLRVKLLFDPPENSALLTALREDANELGWSLYNEAEFGMGDLTDDRS